MPGPVSDSYDPEFGTGAAAAEVREAVIEVRNVLSELIGSERRQIVDVIRMPRPLDGIADERTLRILRFALDRAIDTI